MLAIQHLLGNERALLTCFLDTNMSTDKVLMEVKWIKQLPVIKRRASSRYQTSRAEQLLQLVMLTSRVELTHYHNEPTRVEPSQLDI